MTMYADLSADQVLACKRCGQQPEIVSSSDEDVRYAIVCNHCEKFTLWSNTKEDAVLEWNNWQRMIPSIVLDFFMEAVLEMEYYNLDYDWLREEVDIIINEYVGATTQ